MVADSSSSVNQIIGDLNKESFVALLSKLIGESKHVLEKLQPFNGGPLIINHVTYKPNRGNLIVEYLGTLPDKILSFVGMHMDVVTANPSDWKFDPFSLSIDRDKLRGRGTTDCLRHVALVAELMRKQGETKPKLKSTVVVVLIASEENLSIPRVGVDAMGKDELLDKLKNGPLFWIDTADEQSCIGTGGAIPGIFMSPESFSTLVSRTREIRGFHGWKILAFNPYFFKAWVKASNLIEKLAMEAFKELQLRLFKGIPPHPKEQVYGFATPSTMKPTQWSFPGGGINHNHGDRLTPFYNVSDLIKKLQEYVETQTGEFILEAEELLKLRETLTRDLNQNIEKIDTRCSVSKYVLPEKNWSYIFFPLRINISFDEANSGVACDLESPGFKVSCKATEEVVGHVKPYSITGSLPLIRELQDEAFDVQTADYGMITLVVILQIIYTPIDAIDRLNEDISCQERILPSIGHVPGLQNLCQFNFAACIFVINTAPFKCALKARPL